MTDQSPDAATDGGFRIDVFSDPVCPWCLVGLTRLDNALERAGAASEARILHHPFLLDTDVPEEGQNVVEVLTRKYGREPFEMWDRLEVEAQNSGLELDMRKQATRHPSQKAQVLIQAAAHRGTQHELARDMSHAVYMDARNIADDEVLVELGKKHGLSDSEIRSLIGADEPVKQVEEAARQAAEAGISGVPFFIFNNAFSVSGAQPESVFDQCIDMAVKGQVPQADGSVA